MTRIIDVDMECRCKKVSTALNRLFNKLESKKFALLRSQ